MILELLIASDQIEIDGTPIRPEFVEWKKTPLPLLLDHSEKIGEIFHIQRLSAGLIAFAETNFPCASFSHCSPSYRRHSAKRLTLLEVSLTMRPKSVACLITGRRKTDAMRDFLRSKAEFSDLLMKKFEILKQVVTLMERPHDPTDL